MEDQSHSTSSIADLLVGLVLGGAALATVLVLAALLLAPVLFGDL